MGPVHATTRTDTFVCILVPSIKYRGDLSFVKIWDSGNTFALKVPKTEVDEWKRRGWKDRWVRPGGRPVVCIAH